MSTVKRLLTDLVILILFCVLFGALRHQGEQATDFALALLAIGLCIVTGLSLVVGAGKVWLFPILPLVALVLSYCGLVDFALLLAALSKACLFVRTNRHLIGVFPAIVHGLPSIAFAGFMLHTSLGLGAAIVLIMLQMGMRYAFPIPKEPKGTSLFTPPPDHGLMRVAPAAQLLKRK
jgi:hypothetical protein